MYEPDKAQLTAIVQKHFESMESTPSTDDIEQWIGTFLDKRKNKEQLSTDQLLNALYMVARGREHLGDDIDDFIDRFLLAPLDRPLATKPKPKKETSPE
jgi:hypothetical protein